MGCQEWHYFRQGKHFNLIPYQIEFPAAFGVKDEAALMGSGAKVDIEPNEAVVFVPGRLIITVERAQSSEIGHIF